jgi:hypothetical protein
MLLKQTMISDRSSTVNVPNPSQGQQFTPLPAQLQQFERVVRAVLDFNAIYVGAFSFFEPTAPQINSLARVMQERDAVVPTASGQR